jgi:protein phosphatase 2C family protein 2/3
MSRAIGNLQYQMSATLPPEEQIVKALPEIIVHEITDDDEFLVVAVMVCLLVMSPLSELTDSLHAGIWDCRSSQAVISFVRRGIASKQELDMICENLMDYCLAPSSVPVGRGNDNMTMIVIGLLNGNTKQE